MTNSLCEIHTTTRSLDMISNFSALTVTTLRNLWNLDRGFGPGVMLGSCLVNDGTEIAYH